MLGSKNLTEKLTLSPKNKIIPLSQFGIQFLSIGLMIDDQPLIWRGPIVQTAIKQLLFDVDWAFSCKEDIDFLFIDLPPGTGDVQLTITQKIPITGAVIVSTPQDLALIDVKRAIGMFQKVNTSILGLIENMSSFICPKCEHESFIFDHLTVEKEALKLDLPFLGQIPLDLETRIQSDLGTPIVIKDPEHKVSKIFREITKKIIKNANFIS
jgi:ATP-binding protein involved in chromosome partitioning